MTAEIEFAERKQLDSALLESEQRYKRLLAATTDYVYSVQVYAGQSKETVHGAGCEAVTGYTSREFSADPYLWYRVVHEEDRSAVLAQIELLLKGEQPQPLEHRILHKNGTIRWIRNTPIPHRNRSGLLVSYDGLISDITIRKQAEAALRESEDRLALVIQGSNDGIWDWNLITNEVYFSPRWKEMLGYGDGELENKFAVWEQLIHPEDRARAQNEIRAYLSQQKPTYELEHRLRHKDGSYRWILARGVVLRDAGGKPLRMAGSHVDLTERIHAAERLKQANAALAKRGEALKRIIHKLQASHRELKETQWRLIQAAKFESAGILAAGVAHEVKNPLQTILMGLDHLAAKLPSLDEDLAITLGDMRNAIQRASSIISELLSLSAAADFELRAVDLNALVERTLLLVQTEMSASHITIARHLATNLPLAICDQAKIQQVLINLFINAIQAMPEGGSLTVSTRTLSPSDQTNTGHEIFRRYQPTDRLVAIEVQDTGTGIAAEHLPRIFDPFFTTKPVGVGTGLGLTVTKRIVDLHGGTLEIENASPRGVLATIILKT
jgi:PAS domain S-box-containing protein